MIIDVILRTHDKKNVHNDWRVRYCNMSKRDLIKGCYWSLLRAIDRVSTQHTVRLTVLDDHSSKNLVDFLHRSTGSRAWQFVPMTQRGYQHSALAQFQHCRDSTADLVYSVEDDYLHVPEALEEMVNSYTIFRSKLQQPHIVLYPFDAPEEYDPPREQCFVVHGATRHWRTGVFTTNVMMTTPGLFQQHWAAFEHLATNYNGDYLRVTEDPGQRVGEWNTIWPIWNSGQAVRFNPLPSLALHMQFDRQYDRLIDWQHWWQHWASPIPESGV
jgi:hypothetical protein